MKIQVQLTIVALFLTCLTAYGQSGSPLEFTHNEIRYGVTSFGSNNPPRLPTLEVINYTGSGGHVEIPRILGDFIVNSIGVAAFAHNQLTSVVIPNSVTSIGDNAFLNNQLTSVTIPSSVTSIGGHAFSNNPLATVVSEATVPPSISANAFPNRDQIDVFVPNGAKAAYEDPANDWTGFNSITLGIFTDNDIKYEITSTSPAEVEIMDYTGSETGLTIPQTVQYQGVDYDVTAIGTDAFNNKQLTEVTIPNSVTTIGGRAFLDNQLTSVVIPSSVNFISHNAFADNQLNSVEIPNSVTSIEHNTFRDNHLTQVTIPNSVTSIGQHAFRDNPNLSLVIVEASTPPSFTANPFLNANRDQIDVFVPKDKRQAYLDNGWTGFRSLTEILEIGDQFTYADLRCEITLTSISTGYVGPINNFIKIVDYTGPGGELEISSLWVSTPYNERYKIESIGDGAFRDKRLTRVTMPFGFRIIGKHAFRDNELASVEIPSGVNYIGDFAFANNELEEVIMHKNGFLQDIQRNAFRDNNLTSVDIPDRVTHIGTWAFVNNQLNSITLGANVEQIGYGTFQGNNLTRVTIPGKVWEIGTLAFANNPITTVVAQGIATVPTITTNDTFSNRHEIDVVIPKGASISAYEAAGWTGFKSITEALEINDTFIVDHITYKVTSTDADMNVEATDYNTAGGTVVTIPETVQYQSVDYQVTAIGNDAFQEKQLTEVTIPNSVTTIGNAAFQANQLTSVTIPGSVTSIGHLAFQANHLTSVIIPGSVATIGGLAFHGNPIVFASVLATPPPSLVGSPNDAFSNRGNITVLVPSGSVTDYENHADWTGFGSISELPGVGHEFTVDHITYKITSIDTDMNVEATDYNTAGGTVVTIPPTVQYQGVDYQVTAIGDNAFEEKQLTSVTIPEGVTHIGINAFADNRDMNSLVIPSTVTSIGRAAFWNCHLSSLEIPGGITGIEDNTFGRNELTSVTIPASVTSIGSNAFTTLPNSSSAMTGLIMLGSTPPTLQANSFTARGEIDVIVPKGTPPGSIKDAYEGAGWTDFRSINEVAGVNDEFTVDHITYKVTSIDSDMNVEATDYNTAGGTAVTIPPTIQYEGVDYQVTSIGVNAFKEKGLTEVTIPNSVTSIGNSAFAINNLTEVTIPDGVTSIGGAAFEQNQLTEVTIPSSVTSIERYTFYINRLKSVTIPNNVTSIGIYAFHDNQLEMVTLPGSVTNIGGDAFSNNPLATVVSGATVPPGIGGSSTFPNRDQINVFVPEGQGPVYLAHNNWTGFQSITEVAGVNDEFTVDHITYKVTSTDADRNVEATDYNTAGGTVVTIPETVQYQGVDYQVTVIGNNAFEEKQLTEVTIPNSVTTIGNAAFGANQLTSVTIPGSVTSIGGYAFASNQLTELIIPHSVTDIGEWAFWNNHLLATVEAKPTDPPLLDTQTHAFGGHRTQVDLVVPKGRKQAYEGAGWTDFQSITEVAGVNDEFTVDHITYKITSIDTDRNVEVTDYNTAGGTAVTIPPTVQYESVDYDVTAIGTDAFNNKQLTEVTIPNSVTTIGGRAFLDNQLTSVVIPSSVNFISHNAFADNQLNSVEIPNSVTSIEHNTFRDNHLTQVTIPNSVTSIGQHAFRDNPNLSLVIVEASTPPSFTANPFLTANRDQINVVVPRDTRQTYLNNGWTGFNSIAEVAGVDDTFTVDHITYKITSIDTDMNVEVTDYNTNGGSAVTIPPTVQYQGVDYQVTAIGTDAFNNKQLTEVTIPNSVTTIGGWAFLDNQLTSVVIPSSVNSISHNAFADNQLTSVEIPNSVTSIEHNTFRDNHLTQVTLPHGVTSIGENAFGNNTSLVQVTVAATSPPSLDANAFSSRSSIDVMVPKGTPPGSIKDAYEGAGWTGFASITEERGVGESFTSNGLNYRVTSLNPATVESLGRASNSTDTHITIPGTVSHGPNDFEVTSIGGNAFRNNALTSVEIPNSVTSIGYAAFQDNELTSVTFESPSNVTSIEAHAFQDNALTSVVIPSSVNFISHNAFADNNLTSVILGESVTSIVNWAFAANQITRIRALGSTPPNLGGDNAFQGRGNIDVVVPRDTRQTYLNNGWTDFKSINEGIVLSIEGVSEIENLSPFDITFQFAREVTGFTANDISLDHATLSDFTGSGSSYTVKVTPTTCDGVIQVTVPGDIAEYAPNFPNLTASKTVTVNAQPEAPSVNSSSVEYCRGDGASALTATGANLLWYTSLTDQTGEANAPTPNTATAGTTFHYVSQTTNGCESERTQIEVTVKATPSAPLVNSSSVEYCQGEEASALTATGANLLWYTSATDQTGEVNAPTPNTATAGTTFHYVSQRNSNGCESDRTQIEVTVKATPSAPLVNSSSVEYCRGDGASALTATGANLLWYTSLTDQTGEANAPTPNTATAGSTTHYVTQTTNGCESDRTQIEVTVKATPSAPLVNSSSLEYCVGQPADALTATGANLLWYTSLTDQTGEANAPTPNTATAGTTFHYVTQTTNGCESDRTQIEVTVNALPEALTISSTNSPICAGENAIFTITGGTQGDVVTYEDGTPPNKTVTLGEGGSIQVTVSGVSPEVTLKEVTRGNCSTPLTATAKVTVNANPPTLTLTPGPPVCAGDNATFTIEGGNQGDVVIYEDGTSTRAVTIPAGGKATVPVNAVSSNTTLTLKEVSNGNCNISLSEMATVTVNDLPVAPTVSSSPVEYCVDETATALTATGDNLLWYTSLTDQTGEANAPTPNTATAGTTFHYVSQTTNGCESERAEIEVTVVEEACLLEIDDRLTVSGIEYKITSVNPNEVEVVDHIGSETAVEIPGAVDHKGETYTVTALGANAFSDNPDLATVKIEATHLLSIHADAFADRSQVDLVVPTGMIQAYLNNEWTGFASITEAPVVTAIHNYEFKDFTLYPNPARDKVYIDIDPRSGQELKQVNIRTMTGAYLYSENRLEINTARLPRGLYLFEIVTKKGDRSMRKVIIQ